ncbi:hypothetical protein OHC33_002976 [Knufia fluminis]|uniref:Uncharacterized protein n=1 Tax=Knufia fluminis TaxID=191047 RepID=A0AAN8EI40_9EURO|nr:hypothetical protein OHC33_002976 [Knufia fluminis]
MATQTSTVTEAPSTKIKGLTADLNLHVNTSRLSQPVNPEDYQNAVHILQDHLPAMAIVNAKFALSLGGDHAPLIIDAKVQPPTMTPHEGQLPQDLDAHVFILATNIKRLADGVMDSRYALNWGHIYMLSGPPRIGVKTGDALTGFGATHPKLSDLNLSDLPAPTEEVSKVKSDLSKWGYGLLKNALTPHELTTLKSRLMSQARGEREAGISFHDGGESKPNQRIWCLPNKGQPFIDLLDHNPTIPAFVPDFLGDDAILFSYTANIARPGNTPMHMHTDQITIQPPIRDVAVGMNLMFFLEDVTPENGGTLVMPGSHKGNLAPDDPYSTVDTVAAAGPAGTCLVFESRLWHATGANTVPGSERPVILVFFVRPWMRQQENFSLSLKEEVLERCSDRVKGFLGFRSSGSIGGVQTKCADGSIVRRPRGDEFVGVLG